MAFYTKRRKPPQIILVSLIDILVILLIFFVVTTTFKTPESQLDLHLPSSKRAKTVSNPKPTTALTVTQDKKIFLEGEEIKIDDLADRIKRFTKEHPERKLALRGDTDVPYGTVLKIFDAMKDAGLEGVPTYMNPNNAPK